MKSILCATAIVFAMTGAADAGTVWMGNIFSAYKRTAPGSGGPDFSQVIFAPKGLPGNNANHDVIVAFPFGKLSAMQWVPTQASGLANGATTFAVNNIDQGGYSTGKMQVTSMKIQPAAPTKANKYVTVTTQFTQSDGCSVTASGALVGLGF